MDIDQQGTHEEYLVITGQNHKEKPQGIDM